MPGAVNVRDRNLRNVADEIAAGDTTEYNPVAWKNT